MRIIAARFPNGFETRYTLTLHLAAHAATDLHIRSIAVSTV
jgi:hypothetical protein